MIISNQHISLSPLYRPLPQLQEDKLHFFNNINIITLAECVKIAVEPEKTGLWPATPGLALIGFVFSGGAGRIIGVNRCDIRDWGDCVVVEIGFVLRNNVIMAPWQAGQDR